MREGSSPRSCPSVMMSRTRAADARARVAAARPSVGKPKSQHRHWRAALPTRTLVAGLRTLYSESCQREPERRAELTLEEAAICASDTDQAKASFQPSLRHGMRSNRQLRSPGSALRSVHGASHVWKRLSQSVHRRLLFEQTRFEVCSLKFGELGLQQSPVPINVVSMRTQTRNSLIQIIHLAKISFKNSVLFKHKNYRVKSLISDPTEPSAPLKPTV